MQKKTGSLASQNGFDGVEALLLLSSLFLCLQGGVWLFKHLRGCRLGRPQGLCAPFYLALMTGGFMILATTHRWAAVEIKVSLAYQVLVALMGAANLVLVIPQFKWLGISLSDDALARRNPAAILAVSGGVLGLLVIYAGAITGEGPSFLNNVFSAIIGDLAWLGLWLGLELASGLAALVTEERDSASGLRLGGFLVAEGLILARAVAGDWHSYAATTRDLMSYGWFAIVILVMATLMERALHGRLGGSGRASVGRGIAPALLYVALAWGWMVYLGPWEGFHRG